MNKFKIFALCLALAVVGCKEGCSLSDISDKAMKYKDKVTPEQLEKAQDLFKK